MLPSRECDVADNMINGKKMSDEKRVLSNSTGITALPPSACFFNES